VNSTKARPERYTDNGVSIGEFLTLGFACFIALLFGFGIIGRGILSGVSRSFYRFSAIRDLNRRYKNSPSFTTLNYIEVKPKPTGKQ